MEIFLNLGFGQIGGKKIKTDIWHKVLFGGN